MNDVPAEANLRRFLSAPGLPPHVLKQLARLGELVEYPAGATVFDEGMAFSRLSIVVSGQVALSMRTVPHGETQVLTIGAGDVLGWSPLLGGHRMTATATVLEPCQLLMFEVAPLRSLFESDFEIGYHFMNHVARALMQRLVAARLQLLESTGGSDR